MWFVDACAAEGQSLQTKRYLVRTKLSSAMRCALWKLIFNYGSDRAASPARVGKDLIPVIFRRKVRLRCVLEQRVYERRDGGRLGNE
jgi:hypothetical protein